MNRDTLNTGEPSGDAATVARDLERLMRTLDEARALSERGVAYRRLRDSDERAKLETLANRLKAFDPATLPSDDERLAFWINLYNLLVIHAVLAYGVADSVKSVRGFFKRAAYDIGGRRTSLKAVKHGVLRANRRASALSTRRFRRDDPPGAWSIKTFDPRAHFALAGGTTSCPSVRAYAAEDIGGALERATRAFINRETTLDFEGATLTTSRIVAWHFRDFGVSRVDVIRFLLARIGDAATQAYLRESLFAVRLKYRAFDWSLNAAD